MALGSIDKEELKSLLKEVLAEATHPLSDDEIKWVRLAIEAEAKKAAFRQAVIDKTFIGLLSSGVIGVVYFIIDTIKTHWK